jgi:hypothetical protein
VRGLGPSRPSKRGLTLALPTMGLILEPIDCDAVLFVAGGQVGWGLRL